MFIVIFNYADMSDAVSHVLLQDDPKAKRALAAAGNSLWIERFAIGLAATAVFLACIPAILLMNFGYGTELVRWLFWSGFTVTVLAAPTGLLLRRKRLLGRARLPDMRAGSTVCRGISARGKPRQRLEIQTGMALKFVTAFTLAVGGTGYVCFNL
jgi:hypothetical protein